MPWKKGPKTRDDLFNSESMYEMEVDTKGRQSGDDQGYCYYFYRRSGTVFSCVMGASDRFGKILDHEVSATVK